MNSRLLVAAILAAYSASIGAQQITEEPAGTLPAVTVRSTADSGYAVPSSSGATRTDTPLRQVPQSIQVIPRRLIDDQQSLTLGETLLNVSGVVPNNTFSSPAFDTTKIRGFSAEQLLDGFTQYYNPGDREGTIGIERIEVLKGPNAVLYGGGSGTPVGGVVNVVSKLPERSAFGQVGLKGGTNSFGQAFFDVNQPLGASVLFRVSGEITTAKSNMDVIKQNRYNINPAITFTNNSSTRLTVQGKVSRWQQQEYQGLPATGTVAGAFRIRRETFIGPSGIPDSHSDFDGIWATLDHKLSEIWSISVKARYARSEFEEKVQTLVGADGFQANRPFADPSAWALVNAELFQKQTERSVLANAIAKFSTGPVKHTVLLGADYSRLDDEGFIDSNFFAGGSGLVDLSAPAFPTPYADPGPGINNQFVKNTIHGLYGQWQGSIQDRLHLLLSVRRAHVGIDYRALGSTANTDENKWLPRAGAVFDLTRGLSLFASYAEGMRGQPFLNFVSAPQPARSRTAEAGIKAELASGLTGQVAIYEIERSNVAVTDFTDPQFRSVTTGKQRSRGFETDLIWQPTRALSALASYAYTDAEFANGAFGVPAGNKLPGVPKNSGRLWLNYHFPQEALRGLSLGGGLYWQSAAAISNDNQFKADAYRRFDATLSYDIRQYKLGLTIKNLTNEKYFEFYEYFNGRVAASAGTSAVLSLSMRY